MANPTSLRAPDHRAPQVTPEESAVGRSEPPQAFQVDGYGVPDPGHPSDRTGDIRAGACQFPRPDPAGPREMAEDNPR